MKNDFSFLDLLNLQVRSSWILIIFLVLMAVGGSTNSSRKRGSGGGKSTGGEKSSGGGKGSERGKQRGNDKGHEHVHGAEDGGDEAEFNTDEESYVQGTYGKGESRARVTYQRAPRSSSEGIIKKKLKPEDRETVHFVDTKGY